MLARRKTLIIICKCGFELFGAKQFSHFNKKLKFPLLMAQSRITSFFQFKQASISDKDKTRSSVLNETRKCNYKRKSFESDEESEEIIHTDKRKRIKKLSESESEKEDEQQITHVNRSELLTSHHDVCKEREKEIVPTTGVSDADEHKICNDIQEDQLNATPSSSNKKTTSVNKFKNIAQTKNISRKKITKLQTKNKKIDSNENECNADNNEKEDKSGENKSKTPKKTRTKSKGNVKRKQNDPLSSTHVDNGEKNTKAKPTKIVSEDNHKMNKENMKNGSSVSPDSTNKRHTIRATSKHSDDDGNSSDDDSAKDKHCEDSENENKITNKKEISLKTSASAASNYYPNKSDYHPINDAFWKHGQHVPYLALAGTFEKIEEESARLKIIDILSNYFRSVIVLSREDLLPSIYLCLNKLGPIYEGLELGVADTYLMKAIAQCTGRNLKQIKSDLSQTGDLGTIAENSRTNQRTMFQPAALTVQSIFKRLNEIAALSGQSAMTKKIDKIQSLFVACKPCEARYVIRSLAGKLRIGLAEQSVLQALAVACVRTPPNQNYPPKVLNVPKKISKDDLKKLVDEHALILKTTYCECPNYDLIIPVLLSEGITSLPKKCKLTAGIPLKPMLAQPTRCIDDVFQQFDGSNFTCEWKYDGERAQIHVCDDGVIKVYSRNLENNTSKYPDITSSLRAALKPEVKSCIIDAEAVAWDHIKKCIMPFQVLSTRKRKDASEDDIKVHVRVFMFDILYLNGASLVDKSLLERREILKENLIEIEDKFSFVTHLNTDRLEEVQDFLEESVKGNCEGLMVKSLQVEAEYKIAKRARSWLKLKKDYLHGVGDTLDLVVLGGYLGKGKRTGVYGGFLLACYDSETEQYQSICKIGTGFSDESLATHAEFFKQHLINEPRPYYQYHESLKPDHWFDAVQVWEIKCADLSLSPIHRAAVGIIDSEKGISLRFPRYLRVRTDKLVDDATSANQVAELYKNQDQIKNQSKTSKINEEDFY